VRATRKNEHLRPPEENRPGAVELGCAVHTTWVQFISMQRTDRGTEGETMAVSERARELEQSEDPRAVSWWAWHDRTCQQYPSMAEAMEACAAWVHGESDVGPEQKE
jgi:hypothetical protein